MDDLRFTITIQETSRILYFVPLVQVQCFNVLPSFPPANIPVAPERENNELHIRRVSLLHAAYQLSALLLLICTYEHVPHLPLNSAPLR